MKDLNKELLKNENIENIISKMSLKNKIGQLLMVGFKGKKINDHIKNMIEEYKIGGIIYFARNISNPGQIKELSNNLQQLALNETGIPLFISTDEEGGIVRRVDGMTPFPGLMSLGAADSYKLTEKIAEKKAKQLKYLGINFNLSPVLDVNNNRDNPIIGVRSFGAQAEKVAAHGSYYIKGLQKHIMACGKHFPGHGDTSKDSHLDLPVIRHDLSHLEKIELKPFKKAIQAGINSIMVAHLSFPALTGKEKVPATLSSQILTDLLKDRLGFYNLIITDCMEMNAITRTYGTAEGAVRTIKAGSDQVLISHTQDRQINAFKKLFSAVKKGEIKENRIDKSLSKILKLKKGIINTTKYSNFNQKKFKKYLKEGSVTAKEVSERGITFLNDYQRYLPLKPLKDKKILVIDITENKKSPVENIKKKSGWHNRDLLIKRLKESGFAVKKIFKNSFKRISKEISKSEKEENYFFNRYSAILILIEDFNEKSSEHELINDIANLNIKSLVISQSNPYSALKIKKTGVILLYDNSPIHINTVVEIIMGNKKPKGELPIF